MRGNDSKKFNLYDLIDDETTPHNLKPFFSWTLKKWWSILYFISWRYIFELQQKISHKYDWDEQTPKLMF